jgi:glycerol-1-phosphate dehydrogenase [NAD(P)+]
VTTDRPDPTASHRAIRLPSVLRIVEGLDEAVAAMVDAGMGSERALVVHSGGRSGTGYGAAFAEGLRRAGFDSHETLVGAVPETGVDQVEAEIARLAPARVVGLGGGLVTDVAKLAAARRDVPFICLPTQASSDGICSPVAVIPDKQGRPNSIGARIPAGVIVDMGVLDRAPAGTWLAGLGDLVSNLSAVRDWRWAHREFGEPVDDFACLTAEAAALSVIEDDVDLADRDFRAKLIRGLILSGVAMEMAGSSRPASGSEHLISHALDAAGAERRPHGLQVAMASIISYHLRGDDPSQLLRFYRSVGLPERPEDLGLTIDDVLAAARQGPRTRPGRRTILDRFDRVAERSLAEFLGAGVVHAALP